jgi:HPt (histidine-containing phosphotransfer) domain-containing protein
MIDSPHQVLDPAALDRLDRIGGQEFVIEMIDLFLDHSPRRLAAARAALTAGDYSTLYRSAHSLKSTAANLGALALQSVAERVEALAAAEDSGGVAALVDELDRSYEQVRKRLDGERKRRQAPVDQSGGQR